MSGLFPKAEKPPAEDPDLKRMREEEQKRAEQDRIRSTQQQLQQETLLANRGLGVASLRSTGVFRRRGLTSLLGSG